MDLEANRPSVLKLPAVVPIAGLVDPPSAGFSSGVIELRLSPAVELVVADHRPPLAIKAQAGVSIDQAATHRNGKVDVATNLACGSCYGSCSCVGLEEAKRFLSSPHAAGVSALVKVGGAGVCHSDLHVMEYPDGALPYALPFTLGHENAGWVERVGPGVDGVAVGEPVAVYSVWGCGRCAACLGRTVR